MFVNPSSMAIGCGRHRPAVILFNHLGFADYSARLASMGSRLLLRKIVLYNPDVMRFNSRRYQDNSHADMYFCWNDHQRTALLENSLTNQELGSSCRKPEMIFFAPWNQHAPRKDRFRRTARSCFLFNFCLAHFQNYHRRRRTSFPILEETYSALRRLSRGHCCQSSGAEERRIF